jgi:radical SAM superfamily enzyme YgiQ (UPF0313 family)
VGSSINHLPQNYAFTFGRPANKNHNKMHVKLILPSLAEAGSPLHRPIKYSLFPPLGLATLAAYLADNDQVTLKDQHVEKVDLDDEPDLVVIQVYITNASRAYAMADHYRARGIFVALGGLHVSSQPEEASCHADAIFIGPGEQTFPEFLRDFRNGRPQKRYFSTTGRTLANQPPIRRDLIKRHKYLVPNALVVSRGCPHQCDFCYKHAFFKGGKSFYTQQVDSILEEIEALPGKHLYFLDDHLFANPRFAMHLFDGMKGMNRVFQGAATVSSILNEHLLNAAARAGLRSLFVGFETLSEESLRLSNKTQNLQKNYNLAINNLHELGIMINGSFVFGLDGDYPDVFEKTVEWAVANAITTATFHIMTPYPGTRLYERLKTDGRLLHSKWDLYDTRHAVYQPKNLSLDALESGYYWAYKAFYSWKNIFKASLAHQSPKHQLKHLFYTGGWKKFEKFWALIINTGLLPRMLPLLELLLSEVKPREESTVGGQVLKSIQRTRSGRDAA